MKAVILAAGEGRRLRPFTETMPKVMLPVANKPVLEYVIDAVKTSGINEIVLVVGYKKEVIMDYFKDYEDIKIKYVFQDKQLGTAHALLQTKDLIDGDFLVLSGDNIIDHRGIEKLLKEKSNYSMLIKEHVHPSKYGVVVVEKNILKEIVEKPAEEGGKFISTGIFKFPDSIFEKVEEVTSQGVYELTDVIQSVVNSGEKIRSIRSDFWMDIVYPWDLLIVNERMLHTTKTSTSGVIENGVTMKGPISVGENTRIYAGSYIRGPVVIGDGCEIGPNVCIFPSTTIGNNTVIHPFSEIRNSVIMNDVNIGSNSFVSHSVIGRGSVIRSNFSSIAGKATIEIEEEFNKLDNIGVMIAEDCAIGSNVVVEPGMLIGRGCEISSLKRIMKNIASQSNVM
jgi:UDP-N-acetylglucosamine diphosphorylase/glucosamine-1-phosphate N-acetyltransferase